jgi:hypothetical protein
MSQRKFKDNNLTVTTGWDRQLQRFFLVIETDEQQESDEDEYVFSNLNLSNPAMTLDQIRSVLQSKKIKWPASLFDDLQDDKEWGSRGVKNYSFSAEELVKAMPTEELQGALTELVIALNMNDVPRAERCLVKYNLWD